MFTVKKKPLTPNIIWDGNAGRPLCRFDRNGTIRTDDRELAERLATMGHEVAEESAEADETAEDAQDQGREHGEAPVQPESMAGVPAQQAAAPAAKGRRSRK